MAGLRCDSCGAPVTGCVCEYCGSTTVQEYNEILRNCPPVFFIKDGKLSEDDMEEIKRRMNQGAMIRI